MRLTYNLGFLLGLLGMSICSVEYAFSDLASLFSVLTLVLASLWFFYVLVAQGLREFRVISLVLGLLFLTLPPLYMMSYDSVARTRGTVISASRSFSTSNGSATLNIVYDIFSSFNPLPVVITDMSFVLADPRVGEITTDSVKGGILYPMQHMRRDLSFVVSGTYVDDFRGNVTQLDIFYGPAGTGTLSTLFYHAPFYYGWHSCWNWSKNTPINCLVGLPMEGTGA